MFSINNKISLHQLQVLLILNIFGTGVIVLPRIASEYAAQDGWILIAVSIFFGLVYSYVTTSVCGIYPDKSFVGACEMIIGKPLSYIIAIVFSVKLLLMAAFEIRRFGEIIAQRMLVETPFYIICVTMLLISAYAAMKGYEARARIAELLIFVILIPIILVFFIAATDVDYSNLLPVAKAMDMDYLKGAYTASFAFSGIEVVMIATPYIVAPKKMKSAVSQIVITMGIMFLVITIITTARFGPIEIQKQMWPVIEIMDAVNIPGSFIERQEALIMSFWIISVFAAVNAGLFFSSLLLKDTFKKGKHSSYILMCIPIIFIAACLPKDVFFVDRYLEQLNYSLGIGFLFFVPIFLIIVAAIRKRGVRLEKSVRG